MYGSCGLIGPEACESTLERVGGWVYLYLYVYVCIPIYVCVYMFDYAEDGGDYVQV